MNKLLGIFVAALVFVFGFAVFNNNAYAADSSTILNKWNYTQYYNCAKSYFNKSPYWNGTDETVLDEVVGTKGALAMPSQGFQVASGSIDCKTLMTGRVGIQDVSQVSGDVGAVNALFSSLGYEAKAATGATATINYTYTKAGVIDAGSVPSTLTVTIDANGPVNSDDGKLRVRRIDADSFRICLNLGDVCTGEIPARTDNMTALNNDIVRALETASLSYGYDNGATYSAGGFSVTTDSKPAGYIYPPSGKSASEVAAETTKNFSGMGLSDLRLSDSELYTLYMSYLKNNASTIACGSSAGGGYAVKLKTTDETFKQCKVEFGDKSPSSISVNTQKYNVYPFISSINMLNVLEWFNGANEAALTDIEDSLVPADGTIEPEEETQEQGEASEDGDVDCQSSGAAGSLGWIVCPILTWMERTSTDLYEKYVEPALVVDPGLFKNGPGVKQAWDTFQMISNFVFIILLLVIIFSQVTGFGIDNYGIKKILPKLIVIAILTNLSYYLCLIAVDVSNIVGDSIQSLFTGLGNDLNMSVSIDGASKAVGSTAISAVAVLGTLVGMGAAVWANPAIVLTLFISAIGVVFSIFFLFIILAAREAAVIVLVVAAPVAMACYILPNTKKVFDSWLKMFEGLLLVFPICGLLVGGGNYISKLLLSTGSAANGVFNAFAAMVVGIVPIFFIPSVLRSSFNAMGNLGAKIAGVGKVVGGSVQKAATNSNLNRNLQEAGAERRARIMGGLNSDGTAKNLSTFGKLMRGGSRNIARSRATALSNMDKRYREQSLMGTGYDAAYIGQEKRAQADDVANWETLINNETRNGEDEGKLFRMYDDYLTNGNKSAAIAVARIAGRRSDTAASFMAKKITGTGLNIKNANGNVVADTAAIGAMNERNARNSAIFNSVAKEIATGQNSKNYRSSSALGFEFARQVNQKADTDNPVKADYDAWRNSADNIHSAIDHHLTDGSMLLHSKNATLNELAALNQSGKMDAEDAAMLRELANDAIRIHEEHGGEWDFTKQAAIYGLAGRPLPTPPNSNP